MAEATSNAPLTVVLVHGAFARSPHWTSSSRANGAPWSPGTRSPTRRRHAQHRRDPPVPARLHPPRRSHRQCEGLFDAMIELYLDRANPGSLWGAANAAAREASKG